MPLGRAQEKVVYGLPGLLPWQAFFLSVVIGGLGFRHLIPCLAALFLLCCTDLILRRNLFMPAILVCGATAGYYLIALAVPPPAPEAPSWMLERRKVMVHARVKAVQPRPERNIRVVLDNVDCLVDGSIHSLPGRVAWTLNEPDVSPMPGQRVEVKLRLRPVRGFRNPGTWDYKWYWRMRGVYWQAWSKARSGNPVVKGAAHVLPLFAREIKAGIMQSVPESDGGAVLASMLTGDRFHLSASTMRLMRGAGLAHTLALSGLHVGFVALAGVAFAYLCGVFYPGLYLKISRPKLMVLCAAPVVFVYVWLGQPSQSLLRAGIMFFVWGGLLLVGRGRLVLDALFLALAAIVIISPLAVFDLGLQMSAAAVGGICLFYPVCSGWLPGGNSLGSRLVRWMCSLVLVSLCANVTLLPLVSWYFGTMAPNILSNLFWLPLLGLIVMPLGMIGFAGVVAGIPGAHWFLTAAAHVLDSMLAAVQWASRTELLPVVSVLRPLWPELLGFSLLLVCVLVVLRGKRKSILPLAVVGMFLIVLPHWIVLAEDARGVVKVESLDVGQGQSVLLSMPGGHRFLVDGGGTNSRTFDIGEAVVGSVLTHGRAPRLDGVFMTHPDTDHSQGLCHILEKFDVAGFYTNGEMPQGRVGERMLLALDEAGLVPVALSAGLSVAAGDGCNVSCLHPAENFPYSDSNERSLVLRVVSNDRGDALLCGDIGPAAIRELLNSDSNFSARVLVLPHHGSGKSFSPSFYDSVSPEKVICSCGYLNRFGFPDERIRAFFPDLLVTGQRGLIGIRIPVERR